MAAWESDTSFRDRVAARRAHHQISLPAALERAFDLKRQLHAVDDIFKCVFG